MGYLKSIDFKNLDIFSTEWYQVGGANTVRGYEDRDPFAYGNKQILLNLEYRFLFTDMFQIVLFVDAGYAPNIKDDNGDIVIYGADPTRLINYKIGKGVGLRYNIPALGPLRLDAGIDERGTIRIHFSVGHTF